MMIHLVRKLISNVIKGSLVWLQKKKRTVKKNNECEKIRIQLQHISQILKAVFIASSRNILRLNKNEKNLRVI
jgi:hypothetical protein